MFPRKKIVWITNPLYLREYVESWNSELLEKYNIHSEIKFNIPPIFEDGIFYIISINLPMNHLPKHFCLLQKEQLTSNFFKDRNYITLLHRAQFILEYSEKNYDFLKTTLNITTPIYRFNFGWSRHLEFDPLPKNNHSPIDILFLGKLNNRRIVTIKYLTDRGLSVVVKSNIFGQEKRNLISRSKIILNIHHYVNPSVLETERIGFLLANRKLVISERSSETNVDRMYENYVVFYENLEDLYEKCFFYCGNDDERENFIITAHHYFRENNTHSPVEIIEKMIS